MTHPFRYRFRVRYAECDAQKVVFNARYADYADLATIEFLRNLGDGRSAFMERGLDYQVAKLTIEWKGSARFDDVIEARVRTQTMGNTSFVLEQDLVRVADETLLCHTEAVYVMMSVEPFEKIRIPDDMRQLLSEGATGVLINQSGE